MKKLILMVFLFALTACSYKPLENKPLKIVVANDMHYAHQSMIGDHPRSQELSLKADGKQINYLAEIMEAFVYQMNELQPDVIILNGDLVFNGERDNHLYLRDLLSKLDALVLVTPGNHDIESPYSIRILPERSYKAESVSEDEFKKIYLNFGYKQAKSKDLYSLSYLVEVSDSLHLLMLDSRCDESCEDINGGQIRQETLDWIDQQLKESSQKNAEVIFVSHHNVLVHYPRLRENFTINNDQELVSLLKQYDVKLALSGHIHVQHIAQDEQLTEISTQALSVYQNQVGIIDYQPHDSFDYNTQIIDVSAYAQYKQFDNQELLNFDKRSLETITDVNYRRTAFRLYDEFLIKDEQVILDIASYDAKIKAYYFSGQLMNHVDEFLSDPYFNYLNETYPFETQNMRSALKNFGLQDHRHILIPLN